MWSRKNLEGYMAVTAHYMIEAGGQLSLRSRLVAFRHIKGSHTGENLAKEFYNVLCRFKVSHRVRHSLFL
jgi:hypothetical protein